MGQRKKELKIVELEKSVHEFSEIHCKIRKCVAHGTKYSAKKHLNSCKTAGFGRNSCQNVIFFCHKLYGTEGNAPSFLRGC